MTDAVTKIHTFLVRPGKNAKNPPHVGGAEVPLKGDLFEMLNKVFDASEHECNIDIAFRPKTDGKQQNDVRDEIISYIQTPTLPKGKKIAERLENVTTGRSGLGLLFLISGTFSNKNKIVISRFPADQGILAEESKNKLTVSFLEKVFMKSQNSYKAVIYKNITATSNVWKGRAVDKQINRAGHESSEYWIFDFLESDFLTTSASGTKRYAEAIKSAASHASDLEVKQQLTHLATFTPALHNQTLSIIDIAKKYSLSKETQDALIAELPNAHVAKEKFKFDKSMFAEVVQFRTIELDNGGMMTASADNFDDVFKQTKISTKEKRYKITTEGCIINEQLRKRK